MLTLEEALEILSRHGSDNAPSASELANARDAIAREIHKLKREKSSDLDALMTMRETYQAAAQAVTEAEELEAEAAKAVEDALGDIPDPDAGSGDELSAETAEDEQPTGAVLSVREALEKLGLRGGTSTAQVTEPEETDLAATKTTIHLDGNIVEDASWNDLGKAFSTASRRGMKAGRNSIVRVDTEFASERMLPGKIAENTSFIDNLVSPEAVTAAGGCCSLPTPIYENPVYSSLARPIRDALPTVGVQQRGSVSFFPAVCLPSEGAALWTCEQDAGVDPEDPGTWKQCFSVECDEEQRVVIDAIYSCLDVGNFQARFAPEQWEAYLRATAALQSRVAEVALFNKMVAGVQTTHTAESTGSLYVTLYNGVGRAAAAIRQDQRLDSVQLTMVLPDWVRQAVRADLRARRVRDVENVEVADALLIQAAANEGVRLVFSPDIVPLEPNGQEDGPLTDYPDTFQTVIFPDGYFSFLDGGTLDLGTEIRDHDLNRQNKLAAFAESFEGLLARGCNAKAVTFPVDICEDVPCPPVGS